MSGYTDSEKIQYALKTALYRTMQTAMSDSASVERSAPLRVFPTNIMKVNIIEAGKGDIDEDGKYITGHVNAGTTANLLDPEGTVKNYKIICPVNNVITDKTISWLVSYGSSTKSYVDGRGTSGQSYPLKQWFFRGHYTGTGEAAFNAANAAYTGLQLAWNSSTNNTTPGESDIVPHLKFYLQVQTNYTGVSHSSSTDNITYEHDLLKGLIGLDSNFVSTIMVTQGQGGPASCASLGTSGSQAGEYWFTQPTSGILSFYGVTNKVDASTDLATANFATKFPMISYVRYTGETGFGAGTGGGAGADPQQAVTELPTWNSNALTLQGLGVFKGRLDTAKDNILITGNNSWNTNTTGTWNTSLGYAAGYNLTSGTKNVLIGKDAGYNLTTAGSNTFIGHTAGLSTVQWGQNTFIGMECGYANTNGYENTFVGTYCGRYNTTAINGVFVGRCAGYSNTTGHYNTFIGMNAGRMNTTGTYNCCLGWEAGRDITTGSRNIAIGSYAMHDSVGNDGYMIAIGASAMQNYGQPTANTATNRYDIAIGYQAMLGSNGNSGGEYNVALGHQAMRSVTTATSNVCIGRQAGYGITTGYDNVFVGKYAGNNLTTGYGNVCIGENAGSTVTTSNNVYIGKEAGKLNNTAAPHTFIGMRAGQNVVSSWNVAVGYHAGYNGMGNYNVAIGDYAFGNGAQTAKHYSVAIGYTALQYATHGSNTAVGYCAGRDITSGVENVLIGNFSGFALTTGSYNTYVGSRGGYTYADRGSYNVGIGYRAHSEGEGDRCIAIGKDALYYGDKDYIIAIGDSAYHRHHGEHNIAIGYEAMFGHVGNLTTNDGNHNVAIGWRAGYHQVGGNENVLIGREAGRSLTTGYSNVLIGRSAGYWHTTGYNNVCFGYNAGYNITTGYQNTCIGYTAGNSITTGDENTCVGRSAGYGMTTGESNVYLGHNANYYTTTGKYNIAIGRHAGCANGDGGTEGDYKLYIGTNNTPNVTDTYGDASYIYGYMKMNDTPFITFNCKVGIGTTSPGAKLEVNGTSTGHTNNTPTNPSCLIYGDYGGEILWIGHPNQTQGIQLGYNTIKKWSTNNGATNDALYFNISGSTDMVISAAGNVGIGTTSPGGPLEIYKKGHSTEEPGGGIILSRYVSGLDGVNNSSAPYRASSIWHEHINSYDMLCFASSKDTNPYNINPHMAIRWDGFVGIGTTIPKSHLHISRPYSGSTHYGLQVGRTDDWSSAEFATVYTSVIYDAIDTVLNLDGGGVYSNCGATTMYIQYYSRGDIWMCKNGGNVKFGSAGTIVHSSDRRIKKNIVDVPDNLALQLVRDIPCRYYNYIDEKSNGSEKTVGFIAQEVKEVFPMAVLTNDKHIIPNEMRNLENISWEEIQDGSNNKYKLTCDLQNVSGIKYELIGSNDDNDKRHYEIIGNSDNTFTFEKKWDNVFCYGNEVDDFHTVDKIKIFTLHHSAIQELDKKVIALENENTELKARLAKLENQELKNKIDELENKLNNIIGHLGI